MFLECKEADIHIPLRVDIVIVDQGHVFSGRREDYMVLDRRLLSYVTAVVVCIFLDSSPIVGL